ncbi:hypothetical protein HanRHA438_Chr13g0615151 [Helianthus annuus]|nr:hypothetical protein HanRHA438_Chr13g0615151 [Helianthus annuus]
MFPFQTLSYNSIQFNSTHFRTITEAETTKKRSPSSYLYLTFGGQAALLAHGILLSPASRSRLVLVPVRFVHVRNLRHQRVIWVRVRQQGAY